MLLVYLIVWVNDYYYQAATDYWYSRIAPNNKDSIDDLGNAIQWLKSTQNKQYP